MDELWLLIPLVCWISIIPSVNSGGEFRAVESGLVDTLLDGYNVDARPAVNGSSPVKVNVTIHLQSLQEMDEKNQILASVLWIAAFWNDPRLSWDPDQYEGTETISIHQTRIWTPDLILLNNADDMYGALQDDNFRAVIFPKGDVQYWVAGKLKTSCVLDLTYFPFDAQACYYHINSWGYNSKAVSLRTNDKKISIRFEHNPQWRIVDSEVFLEISPESYHGFDYESLIYTIHLQRKPEYYLSIVVVPCSMLSIVALMNFCLPVEEGEKISMGMTVLLSFSVFQLIIADNMPRTSDQIILMSMYVTTMMVTTSVSLVLAVFVISTHHRKSPSHPPKIVTLFVMSILGRLTLSGWRRRRRKLKTEDERLNEQQQDEEKKTTWAEVANVLDHFFFSICLFTVLGVTLVILVGFPALRPTRVEPVRTS